MIVGGGSDDGALDDLVVLEVRDRGELGGRLTIILLDEDDDLIEQPIDLLGDGLRIRIGDRQSPDRLLELVADQGGCRLNLLDAGERLGASAAGSAASSTSKAPSISAASSADAASTSACDGVVASARLEREAVCVLVLGQVDELAVDHSLLVLVAHACEDRRDHRADVCRIVGEVAGEGRLRGADLLKGGHDGVGRTVRADRLARRLQRGGECVDIGAGLLQVTAHDVEELGGWVGGVHGRPVVVTGRVELGGDAEMTTHLGHGGADRDGLFVDGSAAGPRVIPRCACARGEGER